MRSSPPSGTSSHPTTRPERCRHWCRGPGGSACRWPRGPADTWCPPRRWRSTPSWRAALLDRGRRALDGGELEAAADAARQARALFPEVPVFDDAAGSAPTKLLADVAALAAEAALAAGRPGDDTDLRRLVAHRPPHEPSAVLLVRVLAAQGRDAEALDVVERLRAELADGYGADPSPAVAAVHVALLRGELTPRAAPKTTLPAGWRRAMTALVGREQDVAAVLANLDAAPLVTVVAAGGAGKTRLAAETARRVVAGGRAVVRGGAGRVRTSAEVLPAVLAAIGGVDSGAGRVEWRAAGAEERLRLVVPELHGLVVLDNCETSWKGRPERPRNCSPRRTSRCSRPAGPR